ncbi:LOW QUALITY PROTEIN: uncharacterized protein [Amphiura filiformis]|uniref:LOW QUALITY PROTEIN: uncharacterized protein n=1 Tax=Amphiura filiformis TaxID=82378 RepID=UPI003B21D3FC
MTTLPRLTPAETAVSILPSGPSHTFPKKAATTHIYNNPSKSSVSLSWDESMTKPQSAPSTSGSRYMKLDPLHPPKAKRSIFLETTDVHYQNELRTYLLKREQYHRFHRGWMRPFYGDKIEQEDYKRGIRSNLKDQMSEKEGNHKQWMVDKVQESLTAKDYDNKCRTDDKDAYKKTKTHLMKFRDENKKLMEEKEKVDKSTRLQQYEHEREILRYDPINWSKSLR